MKGEENCPPGYFWDPQSGVGCNRNSNSNASSSNANADALNANTTNADQNSNAEENNNQDVDVQSASAPDLSATLGTPVGPSTCGDTCNKYLRGKPDANRTTRF